MERDKRGGTRPNIILWMYEESMRLPLLIRFPGVTETHSVNEDLVTMLDVLQKRFKVKQTRNIDNE